MNLERLREPFLALCLLVVGAVPEAAADSGGDVKDVVRDLYGGDGITLRDVGGPFSHTAHFTASSLSGLDDLGAAITSNAGIFAVNSQVAGFTFDAERGVPVRTTNSLGPLLAERAPTLGKGTLNAAVTYTHVKFSRFEGTPLDQLSLTFQHEDVNHDGVLGPKGTVFDFELDQVRVDLDLELRQDVLAFFATYGLTPRWDVGVVVPLVRSAARAEANATIVSNAVKNPGLHSFDPVNQDSPHSLVERNATGIGDVILRTKYNFLRDHDQLPDLAVLGQATLPTGDEANLLGTGNTEILGLLVASRAFGRVTPHLNLGYEWSSDSQRSNVRYVAGLEGSVHQRLTLAADVLGRWEPDGDGQGDSIVDLALGAKWNPARTVVLGANLQFPLNRIQGLRADVIWSLGAEVTF